MRNIIIYLTFLLLASGCSNKRFSPKNESIAQIEDFNKRLQELLADSAHNLDTISIANDFKDLNIGSIIDNISLMNEIKDEPSFKNLIETEKILLNKWEVIPNFKGYAGKNLDTIISLIRRCATFDRASVNARRLPSFRGARTIALSDNYFRATVPVAFHIITNRRKEGLYGNMVNRIQDQVQLLNSVYKKSNVDFTLLSIDTTINDSWFTKGSYYIDSTVLDQMTARLSKDPSRVMNVYILNSGVLGEAAFPWYDGKGTFKDYIVINHNTLIGGPVSFYGGMYSKGKTLVHEAGHFLGLFHTFEGAGNSCNSADNDGCGIGDQVDDTPSQKICYFEGCDEGSDSCPSPGNDPVRNYLGYNPDDCMNELTNGQVERLRQCIYYFRRYLVFSRF